MAKEITKDEIQKILTAASRTPTGDNCQPFSYGWDEKVLSVYHDEQQAQHHFNFNNFSSYFTLGMLLETVSIAAKALKYNLEYRLNLSDDNPSHAWVEIEFIFNPDCQYDERHNFIEQRATDRRAFKGGDFNTPVFEEMLKDADSFKNCQLYFKDNFTKDILDYIGELETYVWQTKSAHHDVFKWIRYSKKETAETRDGMPWQSLGCSYLESRVLKLTSNYNFRTILSKLGGLAKMKKMAKKLIRSSAGFGCITLKSFNKENLVEAGRLNMRVWLSLTMYSYGVQPYGICSLTVLSHCLNPNDNHFNPDFLETFNSGLDVLKKHFDCSEGEYPCWVFRTGLSSAVVGPMKTVRYPLEKIWQDKTV